MPNQVLGMYDGCLFIVTVVTVFTGGSLYDKGKKHN